MKTISLKPTGTAINFRISAVLSHFFTKFGTHLAAVSAIVCFISSIFGNDNLAFAAAFITFGTMAYCSNKKKEGNK